MVKSPPAMQETQLQFLDWEDSLEKGGDHFLTYVSGCGMAGFVQIKYNYI